MEALKASLAAAGSPAGRSAAEPVQLASRKPPRPSPHTTVEKVRATGTEGRKKTSKR
jgi:hypothetical protein